MKRSFTFMMFLILVFFSAEQLQGQGNAIYLDGIDDYVQVNSSIIPISGNFTVSVWAKHNSAQTGYREILSQTTERGGTYFYIGRHDGGWIRVGDDWQDTRVPWPIDNQWHNYTVVKTRTYTQLYIDGDLKATGSVISNPTGTDFRIGRQWGSWGEYFDGQIDELAVWNRDLTAAEVQANMYTIFRGNENGLVALWHFDEPFGSNTAYDSVGENIGTFDGIPQFVESGTNLGNAIVLDGIDDYIQANTSIIPTSGDFTVSIWGQQDELQPGYREILSQSTEPGGTNFYIGRHESGWIRVGDDWQDTMIRWPPGREWHNYTVVKTNTDTYLYLDGDFQTSKRDAIQNPTGNEFRIGRQYGTWEEYFGGQIDELNVWNRALPQNEIVANMNISLQGDEPGLVALWHFDEPFGSTYTLESVSEQIFAIGPQFVSSGAMTSLSIVMDIKPGSDKNPINLKSKGMIPVALFTTSEFLAYTIDVGSLAFGPSGAPAANGGHLEDIDNDGDIDLIVHFNTQSTGITNNDCEVHISGITKTGVLFHGVDYITHVGGGKNNVVPPDLVEAIGLPVEYNLFQNYPNPFNPTTAIMFSIPESGNVKLSVYNLLGEEIQVLSNGQMSAGFHSIQFDATGLNSGMYIYKIQAGNFIEIRKMILMK